MPARALDGFDLIGLFDALELVKVGTSVEGGSANEVQSLLADFFAALGITLNCTLGLPDGICGGSSKRQVVACCVLARMPTADVLRDVAQLSY